MSDIIKVLKGSKKMLESEMQSEQHKGPTERTEIVPGSDFVQRCQELISITQVKLIQEVENSVIDNELKMNLAKIIGDHFAEIEITELANGSSLNTIMLGNKVSDAIREFRDSVITNKQDSRFLGTETEILPKVTTVMFSAGADIERFGIERNAEGS